MPEKAELIPTEISGLEVARPKITNPVKNWEMRSWWPRRVAAWMTKWDDLVRMKKPTARVRI